MPDNRRKLIQYKSRDLQEIIYDRNVVNFSDNDKTVPAVYRSCAQSYQFILLCLYLLACHRPLLSSRFFAIFPAAVAKVYIVSFRSQNDDRPSKFIELAADRKPPSRWLGNMGGADFQSRFDKTTGQAQEMKEGALAGFVMDTPE